MSSPIETAVSEYFGALATFDVERYVHSFAPDGVAYDPVGTPPLVGHDALRDFLIGVKAGFESASLKTNNVFACGNSAAVKWIGSCVGKNGKSVTFEGVDVLDCNDDGKITTLRAYWDRAPVMAVLQG